ncbi:hypothetical protein BCR36DRAFT_584686 [Piromyces finnis]|uniref:Uncharacterized protein n=1 Tax=Piromyces finnis TaxID=1754191 RepID=A0A1Y1V581_9FUNG|nr:hypothetical protein BCR36DRAFT_584686 [Piromyces finnis]|eukprot:ORX47591.1 hypothetical protein BCR36DRAFT_584686 [Piromyces finnis]
MATVILGGAILGSELVAAVVEVGVVVSAGVMLLKGGQYVSAKVGEKVKEIEASVSKRNNYEKCCCDYLGPSGKPCVHVILKKSRKEAEEAALHYKNADGVMYHPHNTKDKFPHFHPTKNGKKIPGVHFQFPI